MFNAVTLTGLILAAKPSGATGGGHGDNSHGAEAAFPPFDPNYFATQIFWLLLTFGILYFLLSKIFLPRIGETIEERSSKIADDLDSAARMQAEAEEAEKAYTQSLADARAQAHTVAETTRQAIDAEIKAELDAADAEAARQAEVADARIRKIRSEAMSNIETIATDAAQATIKTLIGKTLTSTVVKKALG